MHFISIILQFIYTPINIIRNWMMGVRSIKYAGQMAKQQLKDGVGGAKAAAKWRPGQGQQPAQPGQAQQQGAAVGVGVGAAAVGVGLATQPKRKNMFSWFSRKKKCGQCGQKLHPTWDQCPYCGAGGPQVVNGAAAPVLNEPGGKARTVALDAIGGAKHATLGWLVPLEGPQVGELFQLKGRAVVGTAGDCEVVLKDQSISGRHAEFVAQGRGFKVTDLGSTNGTFVNDKRITQSDLVDNDNVRLGKTNFKFKSID